jgi:hypothetical protein
MKIAPIQQKNDWRWRSLLFCMWWIYAKHIQLQQLMITWFMNRRSGLRSTVLMSYWKTKSKWNFPIVNHSFENITNFIIVLN